MPVQLQPHHPMQFRSTLLKMVEEWQNGDLLSRLEANHLAMTLLLSIFSSTGTRRLSPPASRTR